MKYYCQRKLNRQSRMDNPETYATLGIRHRTTENKTIKNLTQKVQKTDLWDCNKR